MTKLMKNQYHVGGLFGQGLGHGPGLDNALSLSLLKRPIVNYDLSKYAENESDIESFRQTWLRLTKHYGEFAISSLPQNFLRKMRSKAQRIFQLIFNQTCKRSL